MSKRLRDNPRFVALKLLGVRQRSGAELRQRLQEKGFPPADVEQVVQDLIAQGLLDDVRFADALVEEAIRKKPVGRRFLRVKLRQRGVPDEIAEGALERLLPPERELQLALSAARKKRSELRRRGFPAEGSEADARVIRALTAWGFSFETIRAALGELERLVV